MSRAEDQPWSPFPVQDWSRLPEDPLASLGGRPELGARPQPRRPWWPPLVVLGRHRRADRRGGVRWSHGRPRPAADGRHRVPARRRRRGVRAGRDHPRARRPTVSYQVTESARFSGVTGLLSTDTAFGTQLFARDLSTSGTRIRIWRTTSTTYDDPAAPYATTRVYRANAAVELLGESRPGSGLRLPARRWSSCPPTSAPAQRWTGSGSASDVLDYRTRVPGRGRRRLPRRDRRGALPVQAGPARPAGAPGAHLVPRPGHGRARPRASPTCVTTTSTGHRRRHRSSGPRPTAAELDGPGRLDGARATTRSRSTRPSARSR